MEARFFKEIKRRDSFYNHKIQQALSDAEKEAKRLGLEVYEVYDNDSNCNIYLANNQKEVDGLATYHLYASKNNSGFVYNGQCCSEGSEFYDRFYENYYGFPIDQN